MERDAGINALIDLNLGRALAMARRFATGNRGLAEDLEDAALDGLVSAATNFDPGREVKFWTYAEVTVLGRIRTYLRQRREEPVGLVEVEVADCQSEYDLQELAAQLLAEVGLPESAVDVLFGRKTRVEMANELGMSYNALRKRICRIRQTQLAQSLLN